MFKACQTDLSERFGHALFDLVDREAKIERPERDIIKDRGIE